MDKCAFGCLNAVKALSQLSHFQVWMQDQRTGSALFLHVVLFCVYALCRAGIILYTAIASVVCIFILCVCVSGHGCVLMQEYALSTKGACVSVLMSSLYGAHPAQHMVVFTGCV